MEERLAPAITQIAVRVVRDNTGAHVQFPTLITETGISERLLRYQLQFLGVKSLAWQNNLLRSVRLILEYSSVNAGMFLKPRDLLESFQSAMLLGTIAADGTDGSGLFWRPHTPSIVRNLIDQLSAFSVWLTESYGVPEINPLRSASGHEQTISMLAWAHSNRQSFLGHASSEAKARGEARHVRSRPLLRVPIVTGDKKKSFAEEKFFDLLFRGFLQRRGVSDPPSRVNLRDVLITLLMHGGGLRLSECFQLWTCEVEEHPLQPGVAWVRIGHPSMGRVRMKNPLTEKWTEVSKAEYLAAHGTVPRDQITGSRHAGWKNPTLDEKWYMEVQWSPVALGRLFWTLWQAYMGQIVRIPRPHPYAWITLNGSNAGGMFTMEHYDRSHARAVRRIGLIPAKNQGTTPHGHRHAYGKRLESFGLHMKVIKTCMHHQSIESQAVYTEKDSRDRTKELNDSETRMRAGTPINETQLHEKWSRELALIQGALH